MANIGGFFGGVAEGLNQGLQRNQQADFQQKELQLRQEAMRNAQQRDMYAQADKASAQMMELIGTTVDHTYAAGHDSAAAAKLIQPLKTQLLSLRQRLGDADQWDAMITARVAQPNALDVAGGGRTAPGPRSNGVPSPTPQVGGSVPSRNLTADNSTVTGMQVEDIPPGAPLPTGKAAATTPQQGPQGQGDDVDRLTRAMAITDNPGLKTALTLRLQEALRARGESIDVKTLKDDSGSDHVVFIDKRRRTITDQNGNPYVTPTGDDSDTTRVADAIQSGRQPPTTTGLYKTAKSVKAELERRGFDLTSANLEWQSAQTQVKGLNSQRMIQYVSLAHSVVNTIDELKSLSRQMDQGGFPLLNKANLIKLTQTEGNSERGQLAARYLAAANGLKEEMANLENGGYAPTESSWSLAKQQVNEDYGVKQLDASVTEVQRLIRYRINAIPNLGTLGPGGTNRYTGGGGQGQGQPTNESGGGGVSGTSGPVKWRLEQ